jgi:plastocyanin
MQRYMNGRDLSVAGSARANDRSRTGRGRRGVVVTAVLALLAACGGSDGPASVTDNGGGGGGPVGSVAVGKGIQFVSRHNGSMNPAVDTIAVGGTVTWAWSGSLPHSIRSVGSPSFASSDTRTGSGTYAVTFTAPGTYRYDCVVHGQAMTGAVVVTGEASAVAETVTDPVGDTFGTGGVQWDLTAFTVSHDSGGVTAQLDFSTDVLSPVSGDTSAIIGYVEFDLDQDTVSGGGSVVDEFRNNRGSAALGVDATVDLTLYGADSTVAVYDTLLNVVGRVKPVFDGHRITIRVPRALIGNDDGVLNAAAIVGSTRRPTDFVPNDGHLTLGGAAQAVASVGAAVRRHRSSVTRPWGAR